ncbi:HIT domain-containing protein [Candidatus Pacearchaeota archaeon]|nr:HIT domain-containing protein [Candidatus Pacearchaeota archaeon]
MALTQKEIKELKNQLLAQIQDLPPEQKEEAQQQIESMSQEALETMLRQQQAQQAQVFRKIASKEIPSKIVDENQEAIAVLEIRPISEGHTIIIPKKEIKETKNLPSSVLALSERVAEKLTKALSAKKVEIQSGIQLGEVIINLIPVYDKPLNLNSQRTQASEEALESVLKKISSFREIKKEEKEPQVKKVRKSRPRVRKISRRIP